jgi:hypothetical protein
MIYCVHWIHLAQRDDLINYDVGVLKRREAVFDKVCD